MRLLVALASVFIQLIVSAGEVVVASGGGRPNVVFVNPGKQGEVFWDLVADTMTIAANRLDVNLEILWSERNKLNLRRLGLEVTERKTLPDYLILVNEEDAALPVLEAANKRGIKTLFLFNPPSSSGSPAPEGGPNHLLGSIEPDMRDAGRRMSERLIAAARQAKLESADGKFHMLALAGDEITSTSVARSEGMLEYARGQPDVVVERVLFANWNAADAEKLTARYLDLALHRGFKPSIIWAANDPIAAGAITALKARSLKPGKDSVIAGLNWSPEAIAQIESGELLLTEGGHFLGGGLAMVLLRDHADGCSPLKEGSATVIPLVMGAIDKKTPPDVAELLAKRRFDRLDFRRLRAERGHCDRRYDFSVRALIHGTLEPRSP